MSQSSKSSPVIGNFLAMLGVLFIGLKLTGHIDWSWWWVLSPLWIPAAMVLLLLLLIGFLTYAFDGKK